MKDRRTDSVQSALHPTDIVNQVQADEALRRVVADQIGPRRPGVVYDNTDGVFEVVDVTTDLNEARRVLKRRAAQFAITLLNLHTGAVHTTGTVWTGSDRVLKAVA